MEAEDHHAPRGRQAGDASRCTQHSAGEIFTAWLPYLLLVVFVLVWGEPSIKRAIDRWTNGLLPVVAADERRRVLNGLIVPGLHNLITRDPAGHGRAGAVRRACSRSTG